MKHETLEVSTAHNAILWFPSIRQTKNKDKDKYSVSQNPDEATLWLSLITSMTVAFAFIFSFVGGWVSERFVKGLESFFKC